MVAPSGYSLAFSDEFDRLSIADTRTATDNWFSAPAWGAGFGSAAFLPAGSARSPFEIARYGGESALRITMTRDASGKLGSGLISNTFPDGTSQAPQDGDPYGYYETRLWLPTGKGIWPAFWAIEKERLSPSRDHVVEIDVLEQHGSAAADRYATNLHDWDWNGTRLVGHSSRPQQHIVGNGVLTSGWHVFGVEVTPDVIVYSMDGRAYRTLPTPATLDTDLMLMIDLAAGGGWPVDPALSRASLYVDYVRVYEPTQGPQPAAPSASLTGTRGDDTFQVKAAATAIHEAPGGGFDTVRATVSYTLPAHVEKLVLSEGGRFDGTGNGTANLLFGNTSANHLSGLAGNDSLYGQGGDDTLSGGEGADKLYGGAGRDRLVGGSGADRLQGEGGGDLFIFERASDSVAGSGQDVIVDFSGTAGDRIDLTAIDANTLLAGDQAFEWIGSNAFTRAGQIRFEKGELLADFNGNLRVDFAVTVGPVALLVHDLLL